MGILDSVISDVGGSGGASPIQGILGSMLGQDGASGTGGGLQGLISKFEGAGLGGIAKSWVGNGANQPVSPDQVHSALGDDQVNAMASKSGMAPQSLLSELSQHLPGMVDKMTPNGQMPPAPAA